MRRGTLLIGSWASALSTQSNGSPTLHRTRLFSTSACNTSALNHSTASLQPFCILNFNVFCQPAAPELPPGASPSIESWRRSSGLGLVRSSSSYGGGGFGGVCAIPLPPQRASFQHRTGANPFNQLEIVRGPYYLPRLALSN